MYQGKNSKVENKVDTQYFITLWRNLTNNEPLYEFLIRKYFTKWKPNGKLRKYGGYCKLMLNLTIKNRI